MSDDRRPQRFAAAASVDAVEGGEEPGPRSVQLDGLMGNMREEALLETRRRRGGAGAERAVEELVEGVHIVCHVLSSCDRGPPGPRCCECFEVAAELGAGAHEARSHGPLRYVHREADLARGEFVDRRE